jgi:hypothetical protein
MISCSAELLESEYVTIAGRRLVYICRSRVEAVSSDTSSYRELQEVIGTGDSSVYEYVPFIAHYFVVEV